MRKISFAVIGLYLGILSAFSQQKDTSYKNKNLKIDEVNFVTSYYHQEGDHSPVTGGMGTEKLSDYATTIELKLSKYDKKLLKHEVNFELGIDHYTSASSDKIDPNTISSASSADTRIYPSASYTITNLNKGSSIGANASFSKEFDYASIGSGLSIGKTSKNKNTDISFKVQAYLDKLLVILPVELRTNYAGSRRKDYASASRNSFSTSLGFSQVVNTRLQLALLLDLVYQDGYLGTPFHRIYFNNGSEKNENLPSTRFKIPAGIRVNYFAGDKVIFKTYYRYYKDDWGLTAHTASLEIPVKLNSFVSFSPFYRYYAQTGTRYYAPYLSHSALEAYYTTDDDLSTFNSTTIGAGLRLVPPGGLFHSKHLNMLEVRYAHYNRTDGLISNIISLNFKFK